MSQWQWCILPVSKPVILCFVYYVIMCSYLNQLQCGPDITRSIFSKVYEGWIRSFIFERLTYVLPFHDFFHDVVYRVKVDGVITESNGISIQMLWSNSTISRKWNSVCIIYMYIYKYSNNSRYSNFAKCLNYDRRIPEAYVAYTLISSNIIIPCVLFALLLRLKVVLYCSLMLLCFPFP